MQCTDSQCIYGKCEHAGFMWSEKETNRVLQILNKEHIKQQLSATPRNSKAFYIFQKKAKQSRLHQNLAAGLSGCWKPAQSEDYRKSIVVKDRILSKKKKKLFGATWRGIRLTFSKKSSCKCTARCISPGLQTSSAGVAKRSVRSALTLCLWVSVLNKCKSTDQLSFLFCRTFQLNRSRINKKKKKVWLFALVLRLLAVIISACRKIESFLIPLVL